MERRIYIALPIASACVLAGCVSTSQIPLQKNIWQIQTEGTGFAIGSVDAVTARRAAELTLAQGYDRFVVRNSTATIVADKDQTTKGVSVDVVMFHAREPGVAQAIDALSYLRQNPN